MQLVSDGDVMTRGVCRWHFGDRSATAACTSWDRKLHDNATCDVVAVCVGQ